MLRYSRAAAGQSLKKVRLLDIFRMTMADINDSKEEHPEEDDTWPRIAPNGGIYCLNALEVESLKHVEDLHRQFIDLADEFDFLLEPALETTDVTNMQPANMTPRYRLLLDTLRNTKVQDVEKDTEKGALKTGFWPLTDFLLACGTSRLFGGMILLPVERKARAASVKNKMMALVIMMVQLCGPPLLFINSIKDNDVQAKYIQSFSHRFGTVSSVMNEVQCLGCTRKALTTFLGALFLILFTEITRAYCHTEVANATKMKMMPTDSTWRAVGQITNMWVILWSVVAMPWLFLEEHTAKDIVFDSLGMLFVFTLDDLGGDVLDYLRLSDDTFKKMSGWTMAGLSQCPIKIRDIVNIKAGRLRDVFQLNMGPDGLRSFNGPTRGQACITRLMEDKETVDEQTPLKSDHSWLSKIESDHHDMLPYEAQAFQYCFCHADPNTGEAEVLKLNSRSTSYLMRCWNLLALFLVLAEVLLPIAFVIMYNPCPR